MWLRARLRTIDYLLAVGVLGFPLSSTSASGVRGESCHVLRAACVRLKARSLMRLPPYDSREHSPAHS
jgi:hypothetical protein